jgi:hypothetical protein
MTDHTPLCCSLETSCHKPACLPTCLPAQVAAPWDEADVLPLKNLHSLHILIMNTGNTQFMA